MAGRKDIKINLNEALVDITDSDNIPINISYQFEDGEDFQKKKPSSLLNLKIPATKLNSKAANTFENPSIEDMTDGEAFRNLIDVKVEAGGMEILTGKAILKSAEHTDKPESYSFDLYGNNADWVLPLQEATLYDFLNHIKFYFTKVNVVNSWDYSGLDENLPYVFAPVRYTKAMGGYKEKQEAGQTILEPVNDTIQLSYFRPSISIYWIIYWAFKSVGYKIKSDFFNTNYFRKLVMPWTWGEFLLSEGVRQDNLDFLAKSERKVSFIHTTQEGPIDVLMSDTVSGAFDNNEVFEYDSVSKFMDWTYNPQFNYGPIEVVLLLKVQCSSFCNGGSYSVLYVEWFIDGVKVDVNNIMRVIAPAVGNEQFEGIVDVYFSHKVNPGQKISAQINLSQKDTGLGVANCHAEVLAFQFEYYRIPVGGEIDFAGYASLKQHKFLDFLKGVIDVFNISPQTDTINKVVLLEPVHDYSLSNIHSNKQKGYYNGDIIRWDEKQDVSKVSTVELFSDSEREMLFRFKDDSNDGLLKVIQQRNNTVTSQAKYLLPNRFKEGKKAFENRFFSPVVHADVPAWAGIAPASTIAPQVVALVSENVSNTSKNQSENSFSPKLCYYKGKVNDLGFVVDWQDESPEPQKLQYFPLMFAVNYMPGGEQDPVISYSDELIGDLKNPKIGIGLLRRFFLQRMAIMRNGQYYKTWFKLNNNDIANWYHREHIVCRGQLWELVNIKEYNPMKEDTTEVFLKRHYPITKADVDNIYPGIQSLNGEKNLSKFDLKYSQAKSLPGDLPDQTLQ